MTPGWRTPAVRLALVNRKRVRFADQERRDPKSERDTEMRTGSQEAPETRERPAETDAERLEEEATSPEPDSKRQLALKRKAECDLDDSGDPEMEDSVMNSLAKLFGTKKTTPTTKLTCSFCNSRDCYVASVHETGGDKPVCEENKTPLPYDECGWDHIDDTSSKLLNNTLVEKARAEEISVIRELVWEVVDRPCDEVVFGTRWVDINKRDETKPFYRSRLVVQEYKRQADWSFFTATPPLEALRSLLICATIDELPTKCDSQWHGQSPLS